MWLPECAYAPGRGIEHALDEAGVHAFIVDEHLLRAAGGVPSRPGLASDSGVAVFGIDRTITDLVWSPAGYPANEWYRDFHRCDEEYGFKSWRVTGSGPKQPYDPERAATNARADAEGFVGRLERRFDELDDLRAVVLAAFDTELLGHWWHEGPAWLEHVLTLVDAHPRMRLATLDEALSFAPPRARLNAPAGTWGAGGGDGSWIIPETEEMWREIGAAETETVRAFRDPALDPALADQILREFFLLSASDWPFMVVRGENAGYAAERFASHRERHRTLLGLARNEDPSAAQCAAALREIDDLLPELAAARGALGFVAPRRLPRFAPA